MIMRKIKIGIICCLVKINKKKYFNEKEKIFLT